MYSQNERKTHASKACTILLKYMVHPRWRPPEHSSTNELAVTKSTYIISQVEELVSQRSKHGSALLLYFGIMPLFFAAPDGQRKVPVHNGQPFVSAWVRRRTVWVCHSA